MAGTKPKNVDEYIAGFPADIRQRLERIRVTVKKAAPEAEETLSYQMPGFKLNGPLIYFAAFKAHIGLYPVTTVVRARFKKDLSAYGSGHATSTVRFPLAKPIPYTLISRIVKLRIQENLKRTKAREKKPRTHRRAAARA